MNINYPAYLTKKLFIFLTGRNHYNPLWLRNNLYWRVHGQRLETNAALNAGTGGQGRVSRLTEPPLTGNRP